MMHEPLEDLDCEGRVGSLIAGLPSTRPGHRRRLQFTIFATSSVVIEPRVRSWNLVMPGLIGRRRREASSRFHARGTLDALNS